MAWQVDLVNIVHFSTAAPQRGSHSKVRRLAEAGLPEIEREPFTEDELEMIHMYRGVPDPRFRAGFRKMLENAVELVDGKEPADAGPSGDGA